MLKQLSLFYTPPQVSGKQYRKLRRSMKGSLLSKHYKYYLMENIRLDSLRYIDSCIDYMYYYKMYSNKHSSSKYCIDKGCKFFGSQSTVKLKNSQSSRHYYTNNSQMNSLNKGQESSSCKRYSYLGKFNKKIVQAHQLRKQFDLGKFKDNTLHIMNRVFGRRYRKLQRCS